MPLKPEESKESLKSILRFVAQFCEQNKIQYYLAWGTLIGAVRHQGFIPWDDDIDIWMPRPDYNRFIQLFKNQPYRFRSMQTEPDFPLCFGKVCDERYSAMDEFGKDFGLYVDVFPLDGLPDDDNASQKHIREIRRNEQLWSSQVLTRKLPISRKMPFKKNLKVIVSRLIHPFFPIQRIQKRFSHLYEKYNWENAERVIDFSTDRIFQKSMFSPAINGIFEGGEYCIPRDYDSVLRMIYGDYMVLPPEEKRISHHMKTYYNLYEREDDETVWRKAHQA